MRACERGDVHTCKHASVCLVMVALDVVVFSVFLAYNLVVEEMFYKPGKKKDSNLSIIKRTCNLFFS